MFWADLNHTFMRLMAFGISPGKSPLGIGIMISKMGKWMTGEELEAEDLFNVELAPEPGVNADDPRFAPQKKSMSRKGVQMMQRHSKIMERVRDNDAYDILKRIEKLGYKFFVSRGR